MIEEVRPDDEAARVVGAVRDACRLGDGTDPIDEAAELALKHDRPGLRLWLAGDNGFAVVHDGTLHLAVTPDARRRGMGTQLATEVIAAARPRSAWAHGDHPGAAALAAHLGLRRVRELWLMRRDLAEPIPEMVAPPGTTIRSFEPGDEPGLLAVNAAAFDGHPEQAGMDAANLAERMAEPWFDPAGLLIAVGDAGELLGFHWTKRHSPDVGEVYVVGVAPVAQGSGLGRSLTLAGLHHLAGAGVREIVLYVESDNAPARRLYEKLGFTHAAADTHVMYAR